MMGAKSHADESSGPADFIPSASTGRRHDRARDIHNSFKATLDQGAPSRHERLQHGIDGGVVGEWPLFAHSSRRLWRTRAAISPHNRLIVHLYSERAPNRGAPTIWHLRNAALRPNSAARSRRRDKRVDRGLERWPNRRAYQSIENPQARDVRSRKHQTPTRPDVATSLADSARKVRETPLKATETHKARRRTRWDRFGAAA